MKASVSILSNILLLALFTNCASSQFDKKPPFTVVEATQQELTGDESVPKGILVTIVFAEKVDANIQFDSIYYNNKAVTAKVDVIDNRTVLSGHFIATTIADKNIVMDIDPKKEFGNKPPLLQKTSPFVLANNECVIAYTFDNKKRYFKLVLN